MGVALLQVGQLGTAFEEVGLRQLLTGVAEATSWLRSGRAVSVKFP
jgi:hypothetical protein